VSRRGNPTLSFGQVAAQVAADSPRDTDASGFKQIKAEKRPKRTLAYGKILKWASGISSISSIPCNIFP
jgi:hypothetical protein